LFAGGNSGKIYYSHLVRVEELHVQEIIGYHGTKDKYVDAILKDGFRIATPREGDNHWLGHGIYFYSDYELADWWAKTKVDTHNERYGNTDSAAVIKAIIKADVILDLDIPFSMRKFNEYLKALERKLVKEGMVLDFTKGKGRESDRIRCFWMDMVKKEYNIEVIIYTFTRNNPSYVNSKYHVNSEDQYSLGSMGLAYHERQICVTKDCYIVDKCIVESLADKFDEVIV